MSRSGAGSAREARAEGRSACAGRERKRQTKVALFIHEPFFSVFSLSRQRCARSRERKKNSLAWALPLFFFLSKKQRRSSRSLSSCDRTLQFFPRARKLKDRELPLSASRVRSPSSPPPCKAKGECKEWGKRERRSLPRKEGKAGSMVVGEFFFSLLFPLIPRLPGSAHLRARAPRGPRRPGRGDRALVLPSNGPRN